MVRRIPAKSGVKKALFTAILSLTFTLLAFDYADAGAYSLGKLKSVTSEGAVDVLRNPALMTVIPGGGAIGILAVYSPYYYLHSNNGSLFSDFTYPSFRARQTARQAASFDLAFCSKSGKSAFGIGVTTNDLNRVSRYREKLAAYKSGYYYASDVSVTEMNFTPSFVASYGFEVSSGHSIGFQINVGYFQRTTGTTANHFDLSWTSTRFKSTDKETKIATELGFGYLYKNEDSQAGLLLKSGKFSVNRPTYEYDLIKMDAVFPFRRKGEARPSAFFAYESTISIVAGGHKKLLPEIGIAAEGEIAMPATYTKKDFFFGENTCYTVFKKDSTVNRDPSISIRGGFDFPLSQSFTVNLGGGFSTESEKTGSYMKEIKYTSDTYYGVLGFDIGFSEGSVITIGSQISSTSTSYSKFYSIIDSSYNLQYKRTLELYSFLGISLGL
ncbi:MAG: hypothetical protein MUD12_14750 [Spirochaetes bacterium]|jgi:hypothetical protein|nr:hypothetical protein [Spirochaetota bacterium]